MGKKFKVHVEEDNSMGCGGWILLFIIIAVVIASMK